MEDATQRTPSWLRSPLRRSRSVQGSPFSCLFRTPRAYDDEGDVGNAWQEVIATPSWVAPALRTPSAVHSLATDVGAESAMQTGSLIARAGGELEHTHVHGSPLPLPEASPGCPGAPMITEDAPEAGVPIPEASPTYYALQAEGDSDNRPWVASYINLATMSFPFVLNDERARFSPFNHFGLDGLDAVCVSRDLDAHTRKAPVLRLPLACFPGRRAVSYARRYAVERRSTTISGIKVGSVRESRARSRLDV